MVSRRNDRKTSLVPPLNMPLPPSFPLCSPTVRTSHYVNTASEVVRATFDAKAENLNFPSQFLLFIPRFIICYYAFRDSGIKRCPDISKWRRKNVLISDSTIFQQRRFGRHSRTLIYRIPIRIGIKIHY